VDSRLADVPGFGRCGSCPYNVSAPAELCYACARASIENLADVRSRCKVCDRPFEVAGEGCHNPLCSSPDRRFEWNFAVAMRSGALQSALNRYKYGSHRGWATVFGRVIAGFIQEHAATFEEFDLIVASPTFTGEGGRAFDHTRLVLQRAAAYDIAPEIRMVFDVTGEPLVSKRRPTTSMVGRSFLERRRIAQTELRDALEVLDAAAVGGRRILVYDDVFTDGLTLNEVGRALRGAGATGVCGLSLCRQPYRGR
jgi:predicted amidophosphoribosyltransferase